MKHLSLCHLVLVIAVMLPVVWSLYSVTPTSTPILYLDTPGTNGTDVANLSGANISPGESYGAVNSNPELHPIGGGTGYSDIFTPEDPRITHVVLNTSHFLDTLEEVQPEDVVYIPENVDIDLTGIYYGVTIPGGVTIASNRGDEGSAGGRILQNRDGNDPTSGGWKDQCALKTGGDNVRVTGLRLEGPDMTTQRGSGAGKIGKVGLNCLHQNVIVDNCEISGWGNVGVNADYGPQSYATYIHHNYIHHCQRDGFGYGVLNDGITLIEANVFDYCRHMIADDGDPGQFYEARYNIFGANCTSHQVDAHPPGGWNNPQPELGTAVYIHHNTFLHTSPYSNIRIHPSFHTSYISNNIFLRTDAVSRKRGAIVDVVYGDENIITENNLFAAGAQHAVDDSIVLYRNPDWMQTFMRPLEPVPQMLPSKVLFPEPDLLGFLQAAVLLGLDGS